MLGVGGIVTTDNVLSSFKAQPRLRDPFPSTPGIANFEPDIPGGAKVWVRPLRANVDSKGQIKLEVERANKEALAIYEGQASEVAVEGPASQVGTLDNVIPDLAPPSRFLSGGRRNPLLEKGSKNTNNSGRVRPLSLGAYNSGAIESILAMDKDFK